MNEVPRLNDAATRAEDVRRAGVRPARVVVVECPDHGRVTGDGHAAAGSDIEKLKWLLHVAFSRFPIEHTFRQAKDELGMDHFEVRGWRSIHRHLYVSQLRHLFCSRMRQALREKNGGACRVDRRTGSRRGLDLGGRAVLAESGSVDSLSTAIEAACVPPRTQSSGTAEPSKKDARGAGRKRHQHRRTTLVCVG